MDSSRYQVGKAALATFPLVALAATLNGATRELLYKRTLGPHVAHPLCAGIDVACFSVLANRLLAGLEPKLDQPRGLRTGQLLLIGAVWAGCMAAFEAGLGRLAGPQPGRAAAPPPLAAPVAADSALAATSVDIGQGREASTTARGEAAVAAAQPPQEGGASFGSASAAGASSAAPPSPSPGSGPSSGGSSASFWEDGRALPYLAAVMAAVPVVVGWVRRLGRST